MKQNEALDGLEQAPRKNVDVLIRTTDQLHRFGRPNFETVVDTKGFAGGISWRLSLQRFG